MGGGVVAGRTWVQDWKLLFLPLQTAKGAPWPARTFCLLSPLLQRSPWWGRFPKLPLGPQHPLSTCPMDSFTQTTQQYHKLGGPQTVVTCPPWSPFWLPYCNESSRQSPVPQISWSSYLIILSKGPTFSSVNYSILFLLL